MICVKLRLMAFVSALRLGALPAPLVAGPDAAAGGFQAPKTAPGTTTETEPAVGDIHTPALTRALTTPQRFWAFLTAPETSYPERRAAAVQGKNVFPVAWLPRLMVAMDTLEREDAVHHWGLKVSPFSAQGPRTPPLLTPSQRVRHILGHEWTVPATPQDYPLSDAQRRRAPWPWQVQAALNELLRQIVPPMSMTRAPEQIAAGRAWIDAAMTMPCATDDEAVLFVRATADSMHFKTVPVLARWRQIALDSRFPRAAADVANDLGEAMRLWDDDRASLLGQIIGADIIQKSPHPNARSAAANGTRLFGESLYDSSHVKRPEPALAILAAGDAAQDPKNGDPWTRLDLYVFGVCAAVSDPPFAPDFGMDPRSPHVARDLATFAAWFAGRRASLTATVKSEAGQINSLRSELDRAATDPHGRGRRIE